MKRHFTLMAGGVLLLTAVAAAREARRGFEAPFAGLEKIIQTLPRPMLPPEPCEEMPAEVDPLNELVEADPVDAIVVASNEKPAWDRLSGYQHAMLSPWLAWRRQSIDALPEALRADSDHRKAIDVQFQGAIRGFLSEELAEWEDLFIKIQLIKSSDFEDPPGDTSSSDSTLQLAPSPEHYFQDIRFMDLNVSEPEVNWRQIAEDYAASRLLAQKTAGSH